MSVRLAALAFGALVVGSVVVVDPAGLAPFGPAKWLVVSTVAFAAAATALWRCGARCHRGSWWTWIAMLTLLSVSALVNGDWRVALLGHPDRHLGVLTWVLLFAALCAGQQLAAGVPTLARASVVAAAWLGSYSLWELLFGPPVAIGSVTRRLAGPFGSAAFLGAACCLLGPVALGVALDRAEDRRWRRLAALAAVLVAIATVGSGARAAWVGLAVAAVVVAAAGRFTRRSVMWCGVGLAVAVAFVAPRLSDVGSRQAGATSRLDEWRVATRVVGAHPLLGVGPDGYRIAVVEGIDDAYETAHRRDAVLPDRAHSGPLDVTLAGGVGAGMLYVALVGFVCWRAWQLIRVGRPLLVGVGAAVIAYAAQQLLLFPLAELDPVFWLFAGVVVTLTTIAEPVERHHRVVTVVAGGVAVAALAAGVLDVAADRLARTALRARDHRIAVDAADRAVALRPDNMRYRLVAAEAHLQRGTIADIDAAIAAARRATKWSPDDPFAVDELATAMSQRAIATGDAGDVAAALAQWQHLIERDPHRASWQLQLGRAASLADKPDLARQAWTIAARLGEPGAADLLAALAAAS